MQYKRKIELSFTAAVVIILVGALFLIRPPITGKATDEDYQTLAIDSGFSNYTEIPLSIEGRISSLAITGQINGSEPVRVFLVQDDYEILVYSWSGQESSEDTDQGLAGITGMSIGEASDQDDVQESEEEAGEDEPGEDGPSEQDSDEEEPSSDEDSEIAASDEAESEAVSQEGTEGESDDETSPEDTASEQEPAQEESVEEENAEQSSEEQQAVEEQSEEETEPSVEEMAEQPEESAEEADVPEEETDVLAGDEQPGFEEPDDEAIVTEDMQDQLNNTDSTDDYQSEDNQTEEADQEIIDDELTEDEVTDDSQTEDNQTGDNQTDSESTDSAPPTSGTTDSIPSLDIVGSEDNVTNATEDDATETPVTIYFSGECADSCVLDMELSDARLRIEVGDGTELYLDEILYKIIEEDHLPPELIMDIEDIVMMQGGIYAFDLSDHFASDSDITYSVISDSDDVPSEISGDELIFIPVRDYSGVTAWTVVAENKAGSARSNEFTLTVIQANASQQINLTALENILVVVGNVTTGQPVSWKLVSKKPLAETKKVYIPDQAYDINVLDSDNRKIDGKDVRIRQQKLDKDAAKQLKLDELVELADETDATEVEVSAELEEFGIEYMTPGPVKTERTVSKNKKTIIVSSDIHYRDVITSTAIDEKPKESINLYWIRDSTRTKVTDLEYIDENDNGLIDSIRWIVPHLSNQTYEVEIVVLNVQSYPMVGGNWTVMFNTSGTADLVITAINGTTFGGLSNLTDHDLELLRLTCGNDLVPFDVISTANETMPYEAYILRMRIDEIRQRLAELE